MHKIRSTKQHMAWKLTVFARKCDAMAERVAGAYEFFKGKYDAVNDLKQEIDGFKESFAGKDSASAAEIEAQKARVYDQQLAKISSRADAFVQKLPLKLTACLLRKEAEKCVKPLEQARKRKLQQIDREIKTAHRKASAEAIRTSRNYNRRGI